MHFLRRLSPLAIALWFLIPPDLTARPLDKQRPKLYLSVFNDAGVDPATLSAAQSRAAAVLARAGVNIEWLNCSPAAPTNFSPGSANCSAIAWPRHLSVRIVERGISAGLETFGQSFLDLDGYGAYSNIYFGNLAASRSHPQLRDGEMLGFVIAHEVGHLLLGSNSHSVAGLMQARWQAPALQAAAKGNLFFSQREEDLIRARLVKLNTQIPLR